MVTPDARSLVAFVAEDEAWGFDLYDLSTAKRRTLTRWKYGPPHDGPPNEWGGFAFAPAGRELAVTSERKTHVIDLATGTERGRLEGHADRAIPVDGTWSTTAVSADGTRIATADGYGLVRLWDAKTLRAINEAPGHRAPVRTRPTLARRQAPARPGHPTEPFGCGTSRRERNSAPSPVLAGTTTPTFALRPTERRSFTVPIRT